MGCPHCRPGPLCAGCSLIPELCPCEEQRLELARLMQDRLDRLYGRKRAPPEDVEGTGLMAANTLLSFQKPQLPN